MLWIALLLLAALGLASVALRLIYPEDGAAQIEQLRQRILTMVDSTAGQTTARLAELAQFDGRFRAHPVATLLHIVPGGILIALVPIQLSRPIRMRFPSFHRWTGRVLIVVAVITAATALFFGVGMPFGGLGEAIVIAIVAAWFFMSLLRAYIAIRRGDVATHRRWMLRAVAGAIGVSVVRVFGVVVDLTLTPIGLGAADAFVIALWLGWATTIGVTEWWLHHTRPGYE